MSKDIPYHKTMFLSMETSRHQKKGYITMDSEIHFILKLTPQEVNPKNACI